MNQSVKSNNGLRISVIDVVIFLLIIACIAGIFARYDLVGKLFSKTGSIETEITVAAEGISKEAAKRLSAGTVLYRDSSIFGTVKESDSSNAMIYTENSLGELVWYEDAELCDVTAVISCTVKNSDGGFILNGTDYISAGSEFTVKYDSASVKITVISIKTAE